MTSSEQHIIETAFEQRQHLQPDSIEPSLKRAVDNTLQQLDDGVLRVSEKVAGQWRTHAWVKKAVLLSFRCYDNLVMSGGYCQYYDKVSPKYTHTPPETFARTGVRIVPPAAIRFGAYIGRNTVVMPSYINIGAYIDDGCMIDTWATVGSCAQIGKRVHLSGGAGIGGVLEPLQADPTIIEDDCFIGARSEIVEGVRIGAGSVIGMGVFIGQSTKIYNRITGTTTQGTVPPGSVVVPGSLPAPDGTHSIACAIIVKQVDKQTRAKTAINTLLRADSLP